MSAYENSDQLGSSSDSKKIRQLRSAFIVGIRTFEIWQSLFAAFLLLVGVVHSCPADAADLSPEYRVATAYRSVSDVRQFAVAWQTRAPRWTRAARAELAAGAISGLGKSRAFVSAGPVWRLNDADKLLFVEFGFSPTLLGGSTLCEYDLGGNIHFTSTFIVGRALGRRQQYLLSMRIQHLSNGGLNSTNPGLDSIGVGFSGEFGKR
jgi:hypothetical protein